MDPIANLKEQHELAHEARRIMDAVAPDGEYLEGQQERLAEIAARLAELVIAMAEWQAAGGFRPGANVQAVLLAAEIQEADAKTTDGDSILGSGIPSMAVALAEYVLEDARPDAAAIADRHRVAGEILALAKGLNPGPGITSPALALLGKAEALASMVLDSPSRPRLPGTMRQLFTSCNTQDRTSDATLADFTPGDPVIILSNPHNHRDEMILGTVTSVGGDYVTVAYEREMDDPDGRPGDLDSFPTSHSFSPIRLMPGTPVALDWLAAFHENLAAEARRVLAKLPVTR